MLVKPTMEILLEKVHSRYTLTILAAKRARQLVNGALPLAPSDTPNFVTTACEEINAERVIPVKGIVEVYIPLRPEILAERLAAKAAQENERLQQAIEDTISRNALTMSLKDEDTDDEEDIDIIVDETVKEDAAEVVISHDNVFEELVVISEPIEIVAKEETADSEKAETAETAVPEGK